MVPFVGVLSALRRYARDDIPVIKAYPNGQTLATMFVSHGNSADSSVTRQAPTPELVQQCAPVLVNVRHGLTTSNLRRSRAFSREVDTGSRKENASKQKIGARF
jgi:hypothetical protein